MIGYVTLGTNDLARAAKFYDALLGEIGAGRFMEGETFIACAVSPELPGLGLIKPYNGQPATVGNGVMVALAVNSPALEICSTPSNGSMSRVRGAATGLSHTITRSTRFAR